MNLREEIYNLLDNDDAYDDHETIDIDYCVDNIIQLIEKRIDKLIYELNTKGGYQGESQIIALKKVKERLK